MGKPGYYRGNSKPFKAKRKGYCLACKKPIEINDDILVIFFTDGKMPFHVSCTKTKTIESE